MLNREEELDRWLRVIVRMYKGMEVRPSFHDFFVACLEQLLIAGISRARQDAANPEEHSPAWAQAESGPIVHRGGRR